MPGSRTWIAASAKRALNEEMNDIAGFALQGERSESIANGENRRRDLSKEETAVPTKGQPGHGRSGHGEDEERWSWVTNEPIELPFNVVIEGEEGRTEMADRWLD